MTNTASLQFELAAAEDAEAFIALERKVKNPKLYGPTLDKKAAKQEIAKNKLYFVKRDGAVVGTAAYRPVPLGGVYISNINIDPACQRQGLARAAMSFLLEQNKAASWAELVTHPDNKAALGLYTSLGFEIIARKENYFGDGEPRVELRRVPD